MLGLELKKKSAIHKNQNVIYILLFIQTTLNINCELVILNSFTGVVMALTGFVLMMLVVSFTFLFFILWIVSHLRAGSYQKPLFHYSKFWQSLLVSFILWFLFQQVCNGTNNQTNLVSFRRSLINMHASNLFC